MVIRKATLDDIAEYTCVAENVKVKTELELTGAEEKLEVLEFKEGDCREQTAIKGQDHTFSFELTKDQLQKPVVRWFFDGKEMAESDEKVVVFVFQSAS